MDEIKISLILPALNEEQGVGATIDEATKALKDADIEHEVIVIDDGSTDGTGREAEQRGARVIRHPTPLGYGRSVLEGVREARHEWVALSDADGTYPVKELPAFANLAREGFDLVVGRRKKTRDGLLKGFARRIFRRLAEFTCGKRIPDVNSGFRLFRRSLALRFIRTFGHGFSFSTTLTLLAFLYGYAVKFEPIDYRRRRGRSKVRIFRDSAIAAQILVEVILTHNPIKIFLPLTGLAGFIGTAGLVAYFLAPVHSTLWMMLGVAGLACATIILAVGLATTAIVKSRRQDESDR